MALSKVKKGGITDTAIKQGLPSSTVSGSAQLASAISGSLGSNASVIRSLTRDRISGSLGSNKSLIRTLTILFLLTSISLPSAGKIRLIPLSKDIVVVTKKKTNNKNAISDIEEELTSCIFVLLGLEIIIIFYLNQQ